MPGAWRWWSSGAVASASLTDRVRRHDLCLTLVLGVLITTGCQKAAPGAEAPAAPTTALPAAPSPHLGAAEAALKAGELDRAAAALEVARQAQGPSEALARLGMWLRVHRAAEEPGRIADADQARLGYALEVLGWTEETPKEAVVAAAAARLAFERGDLGATRARLDAALKLDPAYPPALLSLGMLHRSQGRPLEALASFEAAAKAAPRHLRALNNLGVQYAELGRVEDALKQFAAAIAVEDNLAARTSAARLLANAGRHGEAVEHLRRALAFSPDAPDLLAQLGAALYGAGKLDEAEPVLERAVRAGGSVDALLTLARIAQARKDDPRAAALYQKVLEAEPASYGAAFGLGYTLQRMGRAAEAVAAYRRYLALTEKVAAEASVRSEVQRSLAALAARLRPGPAPAP